MKQVDDHGDWLRCLSLAAITGIGFFALGLIGIRLPGHGRMITVIWPATGFALCMLLRMSRTRRQDIAMLAAIVLAEIGINIAVDTPPLLNLGFTVIALAEVLTGMIGIRFFGPKQFRDLRASLRFLLVATLLPSLLSGALAGGLMALTGDPDWAADGLHWFSASVLGLCIVLPFGLSFSRRQFIKLHLERRKIEAVATFAAVAAVSIFVLRISAFPILFLILATLIAATARFRLLGAGAAMVIVLATMATAHAGPTAPQDTATRVAIIQLFLAVTSLICARVGMVLNQRELHLAIIEAQRCRAVRSSRFKSQLLSHVGQEAHAPLSAIIGISTLLESGKLEPDRAQEFAHIVAHNGELLQRLYGDLLDLASESGALAIQAERVAVAQTLKDFVGAIRLDAALGGKPVLLGEIEDSLCIKADPRRLAQIINNLIANSYKYGDNHSPIRVRASRLGDGFGRIEILNTGPGIPLREREAMFRPFGHETAGRAVPGAGLGLSIAKLLAERQGGRINFESIPGRQTRFWIDLPLAA
jgi:signal transduction histidine kinase